MAFKINLIKTFFWYCCLYLRSFLSRRLLSDIRTFRTGSPHTKRCRVSSISFGCHLEPLCSQLLTQQSSARRFLCRFWFLHSPDVPSCHCRLTLGGYSRRISSTVTVCNRKCGWWDLEPVSMKNCGPYGLALSRPTGGLQIESANPSSTGYIPCGMEKQFELYR